MTSISPAPVVVARKKAAAETQQRAESALRRLVRRKAPVTFAAVAAEARVSTGYLHRHPDLAPRIRQLRDAAIATPVVATAPSADPTIVDTLREHIRRLQAQHTQQIRELRAENAALRADLEAALGEIIALRRATPRGGADATG